MKKGAKPKAANMEQNFEVELLQGLRDYSKVGVQLIWQRQMIFAAALTLAAFYYDYRLSLACLAFLAISEAYDYSLFRRIVKDRRTTDVQAKNYLHQVMFGTVLSSCVIVYYSVGIAMIQGPTTHFMSLFFLFAAAIFAAMNNHQILSILKMRLAIYGVAFVFIPIRDVVVSGADIRSELWAQLFTSLFVLYFAIESSRMFLNLYRKNARQMKFLREDHKRVQDAYDAKSEFLSTMSHELRSPLTSIKGSVDMAKSGKLGDLPSKVDRTLGIAQKNCNRLLVLINDILDLQKVDDGKMRFKLDILEVQGLVGDTVAENKPYADALGVDIVFEQFLEPLYAKVDKFRLGQVFTNILSNAAKFSPAGSEIRVWLNASEEMIEVNFSDQGVGIDESNSEKVFDRFSQLDASDSRKIGGTGLGMSISRKITHALDGQIGYKKNSGPGTTFFVKLPRVSQKTEMGSPQEAAA